MNADRGSTGPISVLRNATMQDSSHALVRPRPAAMRIEARNLVEEDPTDVPEPTVLSADQGFDAGFAAGYSEGLMAGRAAQMAENEGWLQEAASAARHEATAEGHAEGLRRAQAQAEQAAVELTAQLRREADAAAAQYAQRMEQLIANLNAQVHEVLAGTEEDLVAMSHEVVCRILGASAATPSAIRNMVTHLLSQRAQQTLLAVHVHPDDFEYLKLESTPTGQPAWQWVADENVRLGGVLLRSTAGSLDARLELQLQALGQALTQVRDQRRQSRDVPKTSTDARDEVA